MTEAGILRYIEKNELAVAPYDGIIKDGEFDGYEVYSINYLPDNAGNYPIIGFPSFILVKDGKIKDIYGEEAFRIIDKLEEQKDESAGELLIYSYRCDGTMMPEYDCLKLYESGKIVLESGSLINHKEKTKKPFDIPKDKALEIKKIIVESGVLDIGKIEDTDEMILDGVEDTLYFSDGKKKKRIKIDNFWNKRRTENIERYPNLALLTKTYRAIKRILLSCRVDKDYC